MNIPYVQRKITVVATHKLSEQLGVPVKVDRIGVGWLNRLVLEGVYLEDESGNALLEATHLSAKFNIIPFIQGKFVFTGVRLFGFTLNLSRQSPDDKLNLQFLLDSLSGRDTTKISPDIDLRLNAVMMRKGHLTYHVASEKETPGIFNPKHIDINNISANISLKAFNRDSINANIKRLSFGEASGLLLDKLSMDIVGNKDSAYIDNFEIQLPESKMKIDKAVIDLSKVEGMATLFNNAYIKFSLAPSQILLKELAPFVPAFRNFDEAIQLFAEADGYINNINITHLTLRQSDKLLFDGMMTLRGITTPQETYLFGRVNKVYLTSEGLITLINNFNGGNAGVPEALTRLGSINFTGEISGFTDNLVAYGRFNMPIGVIETDMIIGSNKEKNIDAYIRGNISSSGLSIGNLFDEKTPIGHSRFNIMIDASKPENGHFTGNIQGNIPEFTYKGYRYNDISLSGNFKNKGFDGLIRMNDPNGEFMAEGIFENKDANSVFNFNASLKHFRPDKLNLTNAYESPDIGFKLMADFTGNSIDNLEGNISLDSLSFQTAVDSFFLKEIKVTATGLSDKRKLTLESDIINGEVVGAYSFTTIISSLIRTFEEYLPTLVHYSKPKTVTGDNNFSLLLTVENTERFSKTLKLPFEVVEQARLTGHYNNQYNRFRLEATLPEFRIAGSSFDSGLLFIENPQDKINLHLNAVNYNKKGIRNYLNLKADAKDNLVNTVIEWANNKEKLFNCNLSASALFIDEADESGRQSMRTEISINQSPLHVNDTLWNIGPAAVTVKNGRIDIDNFFITHDNQFAHLDGSISKDPSDTLALALQEIELSYIFDALNIPVLQFGGKATGKFNMTDLYESRMLNTDLEVQNFSFNQTNLGRLSLYSEWDDEQRGILMLGSIYKNDSTWTDVNGYIYPVKPNEGLSLYFDANDIDVSFLHPFMKNVAKDIRGNAFGQIHLFGSFKEITAEGKAYVNNAGLGIDFLDTYYTFSDSVYLTPDNISLKNVTIYDKLGNTGRANFNFNHKYFEDYTFTANVQANNMLLYDKAERQNPMIFGTVFGSGSADIYGNGSLVNLDVNLQSSPGSNISFNFMTSSASGEYNFIRFLDKSENRRDTIAVNAPVKQNTEGGEAVDTEVRMNLLVDVTPDATVELIIDPAAGDRIKGTARGNLQVQYGTRSDLRMYGGVDIVEGSYNFSLQQLIHRDFKIREGSSISFQGDPYNANMNVNAIYSLTASLSDLDESLQMESERTNVPVNCVLMLDGMLRNPNVSFNIELPSSNAELERQVQSFIDTGDMMARQIVYLLVLSKFYTPDYTANMFTSNELSAVASSAISSQLSGILNSITDKVQIGTNIRAGRQDGITDNTEVEMLLSSQLFDNKLSFNGNFGYRNNTLLQHNVFVGEFDIEYKLTRMGEIRLKAYNHANDMYKYQKQSMTTQGVGIMFKKDFTNLFDLFYRKEREIVPVEDLGETISEE